MKINQLFRSIGRIAREELAFVEAEKGEVEPKSKKRPKRRPSLFRSKGLVIFEASFVLLSGCSKVSVSDIPATPADLVEETNESEGSNQSNFIDTTVALKPNNQKIDLLLVLDDSASMKPESVALAAKLEGFIKKLEADSLDWQMCWTTTDTVTVKGQSLPWRGSTSPQNWIIKQGENDLNTKFLTTIEQHNFGASGDERGIYAMDLHLKLKDQNSCYRSGAAFSVIIISDEDERSVGGRKELNINQFQEIEDVDRPENYLADIRQILGVNISSISHTVHSIIIPNDDLACLAEQNTQGGAGYTGTFYQKLSELTGGSVASICAKDYTEKLNQFAEQIQRSFQRVALSCEPAPGWKITTIPEVPGLLAHRESNYLQLETRLSQETVVKIEYVCQQ